MAGQGARAVRICFVVMAHHQPEVFARLIRRLCSPDTDVVVHIDERADIGQFSTVDRPNLYFIPERRKVHWTGWTQTQTILALLEYGLKVSYADYFIFLAGTDFPIKPLDRLLEFFDKNRPDNFINWYPLVPGAWGYPLIKRYYLHSVMAPLIENKNAPDALTATAERISEPTVLKASEELNARLGPRDTTWMRFYHGSSRWCLNRDSVQYLVNYYNSPESQPLRDYLILSTNSDEIFIQTALLNSPHRNECRGFDERAAAEIFAGTRAPMPDEMRVYLLYVDWNPEREDPAIMVEADFDTLMNSDKFFACKFLDERSRKLLDMIETELGRREPPVIKADAAVPLGSAAAHPLFPQTYWEQFYANEDPWSYGNSYDQTKFRHTLDNLPKEPVEKALELACAEGHFTVQLAPRVKHLTAVDIAPSAVARAKKRCAGSANIDFGILDLLEDDIPGGFDLVVCSEVLYYVKKEYLDAVVAKVVAAARIGGHLLTVHGFDLVDDRNATGFEWDGEFGGKAVSEAIARADGVALVRELRTPLYAVQLWRRLAAGEAPPLAEIIDVPLALPLPARVAKDVIWGGAVATRRECREQERRAEIPILMYHSVAETGPPELTPYRISPALFEEHLRCLRRHGYHSISLADWAASLASGTPVPGRPVIITFDDGYRDFRTNAWPALARNDFAATVFVVTGKVGGAADWDAVTGPPLELMGWDDLRFLQSQGIEIASHGAAHKDLTVLPPEDVRQIAGEARRVLGQELGNEVHAFSFPWGRSNAAVRAAIADCGYRLAVHSFGGFSRLGDDPLALPRIEIFGDDNLPSFIQKVGITEPESTVTGGPRRLEGTARGEGRTPVPPLRGEGIARLASDRLDRIRQPAKREDVVRLYRQLLGREPESPHVIELRHGQPMIDVVLDLARSEEFLSRHRPDAGTAQPKRMLELPHLQRLRGLFFPEQDLPAAWDAELSRILWTQGIGAEQALTYLHDMLSHVGGIPCEDPAVSRSLQPLSARPRHFGSRVTLVVPTINSANWLEHLIAFYAELGVPVVFAVDRRTADGTREVIREKGGAFFEVGGEHRRVEALLPAIVAGVDTDWILRLDDDELPSPMLLEFVDRAVEASADSPWWFPRVHLRFEAERRELEYSQFIAFGPLAGSDLQGRLLAKRHIQFDDSLHCPGFVPHERRAAPPEALLFHFDWVLRSLSARLDKVRTYEAQDRERARACAHFSLYETIPESWHLFAPLADERYRRFAEQIYRKGRTT